MSSGKAAVKPLRQVIKELKATALSTIGWEIKMLYRIAGRKHRLTKCQSRGLLDGIHRLPKAEKELTSDALAEALGVTLTAVESLLKEVDHDLQTELDNAYHGDFKKASADSVAKFIFNWFENGAGGKFFKTPEDKVFLFYKGKLFEISDNIAFSSLLHSMSGMNFAEKPGTVVWKILQNLCFTNGLPVEQLGWCFTDRQHNTIYINLKLPHHKILRLTPAQQPELLDNGTNDHGVLLTESFQMKPFTYKPEVDRNAAMQRFKQLIMNTTPADTPQRYFLACWLLTSFLMDYQSDRGLLQVIGGSATGKSKVAEKCSILLLGENTLGQGTGASNVRIASQSPMVFLDNIENRNLNQDRVNFLLLLANTATKPKAKTGSDTEVVMHRLKSMGMITSIEPFPGKLPELINRTFVLELDKQFRTVGYMHDETMRELAAERDNILSAVFQIISHDVLPKLNERNYWSQHLHDAHPGHTKERNNEHLCTMIVVLEALLKEIPWRAGGTERQQAVQILKAWIEQQDKHEKNTAMTSNTLLSLLDQLAKELSFKKRGKAPGLTNPRGYSAADYPLGVAVFEDAEYMHAFNFIKLEEASDNPAAFIEEHEYLEFTFTSAELQMVMSRFCKSAGIRNEFDNATMLGARLSNDREVLADGGWHFITKGDSGIRFKRVHGQNYMRLRKRIGVSGD